MKTKIYIIAIAFLVITINSKAQDIKINGNYYLNNSLNLTSENLKSSDKQKISDPALKYLNNNNYILSVVRTYNGRVYFKFWRFREEKVQYKEIKIKQSNDSIKLYEKIDNQTSYISTAINGRDNNITYDLPENEFKIATSVYYDIYEWKVGTFYVPFKLRFNGFSFDSNANIGTNVSCKIRSNRRKENGFAFEPLIGIGLTSISLRDSTNSTSIPSNLSAFSWSCGALWHITEKINIGTIFGFDYLSGNDQKRYHWEYNAKPWLGLGINVTFSSENKNSAASGSNK